MINLNKYGKNHPMSFHLGTYVENKNLYVGLLTNEEGYPEPWQNLTVNLSTNCDADCGFIDTNNNGTEIVEWLIANELGHFTGRTRVSGWCTYPEFQFNMDKLMQHVGHDTRKQ